MTPITTILSDLGNVVVKFDNSLTLNTLTKLSFFARWGDGLPESEIERFVFGRHGLWNLFDRGLVGREHIVDILLAATCTEESKFRGQDWESVRAETEKGWRDIFTMNDPVVGLWKRLRGSGMTLTAVSNVDALRWEQLESMGIADMFDHLVLSFEEKMLKQDGPEIFVRALDRSGCKAEEAFFVDDRADCIAEAAKLGIRTHQYDHQDHKALEKALMLAGAPLMAPNPL